MATPTKAPYGDVEYADPGHQADKQKRYPIDTAEHARAAWSYINKAENASKYSSDDLAKVKAKIMGACKKFGIEVADTESPAEDKGGESESMGGKTLADLDGAIECRAAVTLNRISRNEIVFLPEGLHKINPVSGGIGKPIVVLVDARTAGEVEQQRARVEARTDKRVYFDFNHEDGRASFWPQSFHWRAGEGVVAKGEWSESGRKAVEGKDFRAFSPVFYVDDKRKEPAKVVCKETAGPNMGGLVNDPAFSNLPLWAKNDGSTVAPLELTAKKEKEEIKGESKMTPEEIAALQAKKTELEEKVASLEAVVAKNEDDGSSKDQLDKYRAEARSTELELEAERLRNQNALQAKEIENRNKKVAEEAVKAAVKRQAIPPKDVRLQAELVAKATVDPSFKYIIDNMRGPGDELSRRMTRPDSPSGISITADDPIAVYTKMARVLSDSARTTNREDKMRCAEDVAAIYAGAFKDTQKNADQRSRLIGTRLSVVDEAIKAGDVTDANLGTIAGTLVTLRTLELLKFVFPPLTRFTTDFSDQPATFNQTIISRTVTMPSVVTYSTATGWPDSTAGTTDVPVVLNNHKGVQITFGEQLLASTMRRLFDEQAEAQAYQLAKTLVDALYANLTDANFTNNSVFASTAFNRAAVVDIGVALQLRGVPLGLGNRTMLLWPAAYGNLEKDANFVQFATNVPRPNLITDGITPASSLAVTIEAFDIYSAPNLPSNNANLVGFAGSKSALVIVTRTPNDYTTVLPGASFGNVQMVTDPDIGMTVMQVQYVNHTLGTATSRIALMYGTGAGQTAAGQLVKAAAGTGSAR
jgi:Chromosome segregation ATPases